MESSDRNVSLEDLDKIGPGRDVFVQVSIWGPPVVGKYIGKCSNGLLSVVLSGSKNIISVPLDAIYLNWMDSIKSQLDFINPNSPNNIMAPLGIALFRCLKSKYLPNLNFFSTEIKNASRLQEANDTLKELFNNERASGDNL